MADDFVIPAPKPKPHCDPKDLHCPSCGLRARQWGKFLDWLFGKDAGAYFAVQWCDGNKPLSPEGMPGVIFPCAGIADPHLHATCRRCSFPQVLATKEKTHAFHRV